MLVVDVELTCWEDTPPEGQQKEIVEIGICVLDVESGRRLGRERLLIRPQHSTISPFCTMLTGLTPDDVSQGMTFQRACNILQRKYASRYRVWASYGDDDPRHFQRQCALENTPYPFGKSHLNIKNLFALIHGLPREVGLLDAMSIIDLPVEGEHHRGVDDAWNTALLLSHLLLRRRAELPTEPHL